MKKFLALSIAVGVVVSGVGGAGAQPIGGGAEITGSAPIVVTGSVVSCPTCGTSAGTVSSVGVSTANGVSASVANPTTTPVITISGLPFALLTGTVPTWNQSTTGNAATVSTINGLISNGSNITITGAGTSGSPYLIASTGGGLTLFSAASNVATAYSDLGGM